MRLAICLTFLALFASCAGADPPLPNPTVSVSPFDISTGAELGAEVFVQLPTDDVVVQLVTWPGLEPVDTPIMRLDEGDVARFEVVPDGPLPDGWYGVRVSAAAISYSEGWHVLDPGRVVVSRIGVGASPRVSSVRADAGGRVRVRFSERTADVAGVTVTQEGSTCTRVPTHAEPVPELSFECAAAWPGEVRVTLEGMTSTRGVPFLDADVSGTLDVGDELVELDARL